MIADKKVRNWITWTSNYDSELLVWRLEKKIRNSPNGGATCWFTMIESIKKNKLKEHMIYSVHSCDQTQKTHRTETNNKKLWRATQQAQGHQSSTRQPLDAVFSRIFLSSFVGWADLRWFFERQVFPLRDEVFIVLVIPFYLVLAVFFWVFFAHLI